MGKRKRWREPSMRSSIMVAGVLQVLLAPVALLDLRRRPSDQVKGSKKLRAAAAFVNFVGPLAYFAFGRRPTEPTSLHGVDRHHPGGSQRARRSWPARSEAGDRVDGHGLSPSGAKVAGSAGDLDDLAGVREPEVVQPLQPSWSLMAS
jgi:hypothetical protein